jgi:hypothetical protein
VGLTVLIQGSKVHIALQGLGKSWFKIYAKLGD